MVVRAGKAVAYAVGRVRAHAAAAGGVILKAARAGVEHRAAAGAREPFEQGADRILAVRAQLT